MNRRHFLEKALGAAAAARAHGQEAKAEDDAIRQSREAALSILKPGPGQLERGLQLHAASIVIDVYGFGPRAALDGEAFRAALEAGASDSELNDLREEMSMTRFADHAREKAEFMAAWRASGVTCLFQNAGEESQDPLRLLKRLARFTHVTDRMRDFVRKAVHPDDIEAAKREKTNCFYFSGNGVPLAQQWNSVEEELRYVRIFYQLGIRMMHLTYNRRNLLGDGCAEPANGGLSDLGRAAVAEMNRVGVIVDVAHSGWRTSLEAARASAKPMVASHSGCAAVNRHIRCKPDEVIRAIADSGGYIGICCIPSFLGRGGDISALLDHIDHVRKRFGVDHVAIGTDVAHVSRFAAAENARIPASRRSRTRYEYYWPPDAFAGYPSRSPSLAWTNWPMFTVGLAQRGYSDGDIRKILGGNMMRVARAAQAG